jgi:hypothetical protein
MHERTFQGRRVVQLENEEVRVSLTVEGGHVAEILHKPSGVSPLWIPPWTSIEPSQYDPARDSQYGSGAEAKLLAGLLGHNVCIGLFGPPSGDEAAAGITVHGEASVGVYEVEDSNGAIVMRVNLPAYRLRFAREVRLVGSSVRFLETVHNLASLDVPIAWTQHVTLGPPFLEPGVTRFELTAQHAKTFEGEFGTNFRPGAEFDWPLAPGRDGGAVDQRVQVRGPSGGYTAQLMDTRRSDAWFAAWSPTSKLQFGYRWNRTDFPWCGIWDENGSRGQAPWNGLTVARGVEFGVSPFPETRREMIGRRSLFGVDTFRWIAARSSATVDYEARIAPADEPGGLFEG